MTGDATAEWVRWWCCTWQWAHPTWRAQFVAGEGDDIHRYDAVLRSQHSRFLQHVGICADQPPPPNTDVLQWLALTTGQQQEALALVRLICFARGSGATTKLEPNEQWCRGVAKALRPGSWLSPEIADGRCLLGAWLGVAHWSRLRLTWPQGEVAEVLISAPGNKLNTLWQAVLWRIASAE